MAFDWLMFAQRYNIDHTTSGHNARRGWIGIRCPWCHDDPSHHLGVKLSNGIYHCWRGQDHKGASPYRLIMALLGCSLAEAESIYGSGSTSFARSDNFAEDALRRLGIKQDQPVRHHSAKLEFLPEFKPVQNSGLCRRLVYPYLNKRGYTDLDIDWLADRYNLQFAASGPFSYRIIIPIEVESRVVNWTGRSIAKDEGLRYHSLSTDPDTAAKNRLPTATLSIKDTLFDLDTISRGGDTLVVGEGPFDAMRMAFFGEQYDINATCFFGMQVTPVQLDVLGRVARRYKRVFSLFDQGTQFDTFLRIPDSLGIRELNLPPGIKDPALLTEKLFGKLFGL